MSEQRGNMRRGGIENANYDAPAVRMSTGFRVAVKHSISKHRPICDHDSPKTIIRDRPRPNPTKLIRASAQTAG